MTISDPFGWAESAAPGDVTEPPGGVRLAGYQFEDELPHDEFNAIIRGLYRHIRDQRTPYTAAEDLDLEPGQVAHVAQYAAPFHYPGDATGGTAGTKLVATNGQAYAYGYSANTLAVETETVVQTVAVSPTGSMVGLTMTDTLLVHNMAVDGTITAHNLSDMSLAWTTSSAGAIGGLFTDGVDIYELNNTTLIKRNGATGAVLWTSASHGASLNAGCTFGDGIVYVGGAVGLGGATVRVLDASTGATLESRTTIVPAVRCMAVDAYNLYISDNTAETVKLDRLNGGALASGSEPIGFYGELAVDDKFLYLVTGADTFVRAIPKAQLHTLSLVVTPDPHELLTVYNAFTSFDVLQIAVGVKGLFASVNGDNAKIWPTFFGVKQVVRAPSSGNRHPHKYAPADWGV